MVIRTDGDYKDKPKTSVHPLVKAFMWFWVIMAAVSLIASVK